MVLQSYSCFRIDFQHRPLPSASRHPAAARPCHACPKQQPSGSPAKERARHPRTRRARILKIGLRGAANNLRRALNFGGLTLEFTSIINVLLWVSGRAVDSGGQKLGFKSPALCFFFFSSESPGLSFSGVQASPTVNFFLFACFCMDFCMTYFIFLFFLLQV